MAGDPLKHVQPGQALRIPAQVWNRLLDLAGDTPPTNFESALGVASAFPHCSIISVKKTTSGDIGQFEAMHIEDPIFTPANNEGQFRQRPLLKGQNPTTSINDMQYRARWGVAQEPIKSLKIGRVAVAGVTLARIAATTNTALAPWVELSSGSPILKKSWIGSARVLYDEGASPQTNERWAVIRIGDPARTIVARTTGSTTIKGNSVTCEIIRDGLTTGETLLATNTLDTLAIGENVIISLDSANPQIVAVISRGHVEGVLDGALAIGSPSSPSTTTLSIYRTPGWVDTTTNITITNRSPAIFGNTGNYVSCLEINGELRPVHVGRFGAPVYGDGTRPSASTSGAGAIIFNTTDGQLNISNGTNWTLPDGTVT